MIKDLSARDPEKVSRAMIDFINTKLKSNPVKANEMESDLAERISQKLGGTEIGVNPSYLPLRPSGRSAFTPFIRQPYYTQSHTALPVSPIPGSGHPATVMTIDRASQQQQSGAHARASQRPQATTQQKFRTTYVSSDN